MLPIQQNFLSNRINRPALRDKQKYGLRELKGIIAHWTANTAPNADADAHQRYFNSTSSFTSAHYMVDDQAIIQLIPNHEVAYHIGAQNYKAVGQSFIGDSQLSANYFAIGFEMCVNSNGNWSKTYRHAVDLAAFLLHKYQFGIDQLYRHYDITGKDCPKMMLRASDWALFRNEVKNALLKLFPAPIGFGRVQAFKLNVRTGPGSNYTQVDALNKGEQVVIYVENGAWRCIGQDRWVHGGYLDNIGEKQDAKIRASQGASIRTGPGTAFLEIEIYPKGAFVSALLTEGDWTQIGEGRWLETDQIELVDRRRLATVVNANYLNVRSGPGSQYARMRQLRRGDIVEVFEESGNWWRIGVGEWTYKSYLSEN